MAAPGPANMDARRVDPYICYSKLVALNDAIAEALEEIVNQEANVEILDGGNDGYVRMDVECGLFRSCAAEYGICHAQFVVVYTYVTVVIYAEVAKSPDKMKYVFSRSRGEDESFAKLVCDLCFALRISLSKKRRLVAKVEALGEREGAAKPFEHMKKLLLVMRIWFFELGRCGEFVALHVCLTGAMANDEPVARRAIDELAKLSGKTEIPKFIKFFKLQQIFEARLFINVLRDEARKPRNRLAQLNVMIVEMEAMDDSNEVYDSLKCLREDILAENNKLMGLNEFVADAEEDIDMKEGTAARKLGKLKLRCVEIGEDYRLDMAINSAAMEVDNVVNRRALFIEELDSLGVRHVPAKFTEFLKEIQAKDGRPWRICKFWSRFIWMYSAGNGLFGYGLQIRRWSNYAESTYLKDKMKFWFTRARTEDQAFVVLMCDVCLELKIKMHKTRRLIVELEALGEVGDAITSLNHMREIVGRESAKLAVLEQLSASTDVAMHLKDGYVTDME
uniref:Uncharacterized protein n=1 Tax=Tanacetum cinerariifolium TaxID=118510 RepID=A0A6L2J5Q2_TANCI|nr:hypothetical protein [Tanacetum cinerariifolium]